MDMISSDGRLSGRVALVTGGARRIGRAIVQRLARDGAAVAVNARTSADDVAEVVDDIRRTGGRAMPALADITDADANSRMVEAVFAEFGRLDIVVHNAVVREHNRLLDLDLATWRAAISVVLDGAFLTAKHAASHLEASGGTLIMIGGASGFVGGDGPATPTAKAGLMGLVRSLSLELGPLGVTANLVSPGRIEADDDRPERKAWMAGVRPDSQIPLRRPGHPNDIADVVAAMAGPDFRYVTGQVVHVTGGFYMG